MTERPLPWERLCKRFDKPLEFEHALAAGGLDWSVELADLHYTRQDGSTIAAPGHSAVYREDTGAVLGVVAGAYAPVSNSDALALMEDIGDVEFAWESHGGQRVGMASRMGEFEVAGFEKLETWIELTTGHDGKRSLRTRPVVVQLACLNQLPPALGEMFGHMRHRIIHTQGAADRTLAAAEAIDTAEAAVSRVSDAIETLLEFEADDGAMSAALDSAARATELTPDTRARCNQHIAGLRATSPTLRDDVRPTAWGVMHAATEYWTHTRAHRSQRSAWAALNEPRGAGKLYCNALASGLRAMAA